MKERKHEAPPRYDAAFKEGAIRLVAEEGRPMREVAEELGVCTDTIASITPLNLTIWTECFLVI